MKKPALILPILLLSVIGCSPKPQEITINGIPFTVPKPVPADKVSNPVEILKAAGAIPGEGAVKGEYAAAGYWTAFGKFPGAHTQITVNSFPNRKAMEENLANDGNAVGSDTHKVLIGKEKPFYVVIIGMVGLNGGATFDVDLEQVANKIGAEVRP
jgi:hypothetical protein